MIVIIDSGGANISSLIFGIQRLNKKVILSCDPSVIQEADYVILPGVGTANDSMQKLHNTKMLNCIKKLKQPVLGICLGMQLLFEHSEEGNTNLIGIIEGNVTLMKPENLTVPHMGWNNIKIKKETPITQGLKSSEYFYFVHSYIAPNNKYVLAYSEYGVIVPAIVNKNNFFGMQFHPERSADAGSLLLKNFLELKL